MFNKTLFFTVVIAGGLSGMESIVMMFEDS